jgi:hypothetical protein
MKALKIIILLSTISVFATAHADVIADLNMSPIVGADLHCSDSASMFSIDIDGQRVWSTEPGSTNGLEFENVRIQTSKCPLCYNITANFLGSEVLMEINGIDSGVAVANVKMSAFIAEENETEEVLIEGLLCSTNKEKL